MKNTILVQNAGDLCGAIAEDDIYIIPTISNMVLTNKQKATHEITYLGGDFSINFEQEKCDDNLLAKDPDAMRIVAYLNKKYLCFFDFNGDEVKEGIYDGHLDAMSDLLADKAFELIFEEWFAENVVCKLENVYNLHSIGEILGDILEPSGIEVNVESSQNGKFHFDIFRRKPFDLIASEVFEIVDKSSADYDDYYDDDEDEMDEDDEDYYNDDEEDEDEFENSRLRVLEMVSELIKLAITELYNHGELISPEGVEFDV